MPHASNVAELDARGLDERIAALEDELRDLRSRRRAIEDQHHEDVTVADLAVGDKIQLSLIASNDGWEWVSATVLALEPLRVGYWDGSEQTWGVTNRIPSMRRAAEAE